jgi:hypothetical protein
MSAECGTLRNMTEETRTEKISVNLTPGAPALLDAYADRHHWTRSTAAAVLIERGYQEENKIREGQDHDV